MRRRAFSATAAPAAPQTTSAAPAAKPGAAAAPSVAVVLRHEQIARAAYDLWLIRGRPQGQSDLIWQEAEKHLRLQTLSADREPGG
jgi:hypothetical protein